MFCLFYCTFECLLFSPKTTYSPVTVLLWKRHDLEKMWCEITVNSTHGWGMPAPLRSIPTFFPFYLVHFSQHSNKSVIVGIQEGCFHLTTIKPLQIIEGIGGLLFSFCSLFSFFLCDTEFLALESTSSQTIIAFSSLGSFLFSIWSLISPLDMGEGGWNRSLLGSVISYGLSGEMEDIDHESTNTFPLFACTANKTYVGHKNSWIINHLNVRFCWLYVLYFLHFSLYY